MSFLKVTRANAVVNVTFDRPEKRNAFDAEAIAEVTRTFTELAGDPQIRAVILRGAGPSFCAGGDLAWMRASVQLSREENLKDAEKLFDMFAAVRSVSCPVLAYVHGSCFGGGLGVIAACDVVVAKPDAQFCFSEVKLGLVPAVISPFVAEKARPHKVREWFLTAKVFDAAEALDGGLVHHVGDESYLEQTLASVLNAAPGAVASAKHLHQSLDATAWSDVRARVTALIAERRVSAEGQHGLESFLNKSKPRWSP